MGEDQSERLLGVGILGAAAIAKKVVRGIKVSTAPLGWASTVLANSDSQLLLASI